MKKQSALEFLVKHLDKWPAKKKYGPVVSGWHWIRDSSGLIVLVGDHEENHLEYITESGWVEKTMINHFESSIVQKSPLGLLRSVDDEGNSYLYQPCTPTVHNYADKPEVTTIGNTTTTTYKNGDVNIFIKAK